MAEMLICSSQANPAAPGHLRRVCGICWCVGNDCRCYAVGDVGLVRHGDRNNWISSLGLDLMDRQYIGTYRTRREAVAAVLNPPPEHLNSCVSGADQNTEGKP